ncbi:MAG: Na-translocating system protein MpsC family protein [Solirubrobacteraceae bacterium]
MAPSLPGIDAEHEDEFSTLASISREMVRLYKDQFGRGPTAARTYWAGPDMICTLLHETLTPAERNLVKLGEHQRLRDTRAFFQYATVREFCEPVERHTGRKVAAFFSSVDTVADGACIETFLLHPEGYDGPSRVDCDERSGS